MTTVRGIAFLALGVVAAAGVLVSASAGQVAGPEKPTLTTTLGPWSTETTATFAFSSSPDATGFLCRLDSNAAGGEPCTSPATYQSLAEGAHFFQVRAVDASNAESTPATFEWTVDLTPPSLPDDIVTEAVGPEGTNVAFAATDNLDQSPGLACTPSSGSTFPLGPTDVSCTATDAAGNRREGSFEITVRDTTPPTLEPHQDVIRDQESAQGAVVTYMPPDALDIADPDPVVQCAPAPGSVFPIGETEVTCTARDAAGLTSDAVTFKVIVQQGAVPAKPGITSNVSVLTNRREASFELDLEPGVSAECRLEGPSGSGSFTQCASPKTYSGLVDGPYLFTVQVTNGIGNVNQASYAWTVDLTSPVAVVRFSARPGPRVVNLAWTTPIDVDYERVRIFRKRAGSGAYELIAERVDAASYTDRRVSNHVRYLYRIRSVDLAGNASAAADAWAWPTPILSPRYDAIVHRPPVVDWKPVRNAAYYNMQLWRDGRKLLSVWPAGSQYRLRSSWTFLGRRHMLAGGRITVYVWAGFGAKAAARYGPLYGQTRFTLG